MLRSRRIAQLLIVVTVFAVITTTAGIAVTSSLYRSAFENNREHLAQLARSQAALIDAVARYDARMSDAPDPREAAEATLSQVLEGWRGVERFGGSGEFVIARRSADGIEYLGNTRSGELPPTIPLAADVAEPMRRALRGESGTMVGLDYDGVEVLAAYEWVPTLGVGIVVKRDVAEVREPLWNTAIIGLSVGGALILLGSLLVVAVGDRLERDVQAERTRYLALFEGSPDGQFVLAEGRFEEANERGCAMWQRTREEVIGRSPEDFSPEKQPDGRSSKQLARERMEAALRGDAAPFTWRHVRADGSTLDVEVMLQPIELGGKPRLMANVRDITERQRREEAQVRLLAVLAQTADAIGMTDEDGRMLYMNAAARELAGLSRDADITSLTAGIFLGAQEAAAMETAARDGVWKGEQELVRADGGKVDVSQVVTAHYAESGKVRFFSHIARDVTTRRQAEAQTRRLTTAIEQITEGIMITDVDGTIEYVNRAMTEISGYGHDELIGQNPRIFKSDRQPDGFYRHMWNTISHARTWSGRLINRRKDGTLYEEGMTITPLRGADGELAGHVATKRDITHTVQLQSQLQQAQKMEAIGQLAGGVAHDFNNMLTGITGYAQLLRREITAEDAQDDLQQILTLSRRAGELTQQLLAFSRRQELEKTELDLNELIEGTLKMLRRLIPEDIEVQFTGAEKLSPVMADSGQIVQVVMNLAVNARDAMPRGGELIIETEEVELDSEYVDAHIGMEEGRYVLLSISDSGAGMDAETQKHIFEPFFTTKEPGHGTGLGLATVFGIVKQHGGHVDVYSEPDVGTTFRAYLPAAETAAEASAGASVTVDAGSRSIPPQDTVVLLVEDEETVRDIVERTLKMLGCRVLTAASASQARETFARNAAAIDLLLTDVVMPGGLGTDLYEELSTIDADLKVLFMSGYPDRGASQLANLPDNAWFLRKPFSPDALADRLVEILGSATADGTRSATDD